MIKPLKHLSILFAAYLATGCNKPFQADNKPVRTAVIANPSPEYLSPEESMKSFNVPEGFKLELVANESMLNEPVAIAWDGNGRMFVAEMSTYMQDVDGTGTREPVGRILLLEDTDNDGRNN